MAHKPPERVLRIQKMLKDRKPEIEKVNKIFKKYSPLTVSLEAGSLREWQMKQAALGAIELQMQRLENAFGRRHPKAITVTSKDMLKATPRLEPIMSAESSSDLQLRVEMGQGEREEMDTVTGEDEKQQMEDEEGMQTEETEKKDDEEKKTKDIALQTKPSGKSLQKLKKSEKDLAKDDKKDRGRTQYYHTTRLAAWRATRFKDKSLFSETDQQHGGEKLQGLNYTDFLQRVAVMGARGDRGELETTPHPIQRIGDVPLLAPFKNKRLKVPQRSPLFQPKHEPPPRKTEDENKDDKKKAKKKEKEKEKEKQAKVKVKAPAPKSAAEKGSQKYQAEVRSYMSDDSLLTTVCSGCAMAARMRMPVLSRVDSTILRVTRKRGVWKRCRDSACQTDPIMTPTYVPTPSASDTGQGWAFLSDISVSGSSSPHASSTDVSLEKQRTYKEDAMFPPHTEQRKVPGWVREQFYRDTQTPATRLHIRLPYKVKSSSQKIAGDNSNKNSGEESWQNSRKKPGKSYLPDIIHGGWVSGNSYPKTTRDSVMDSSCDSRLDSFQCISVNTSRHPGTIFFLNEDASFSRNASSESVKRYSTCSKKTPSLHSYRMSQTEVKVKSSPNDFNNSVATFNARSNPSSLRNSRTDSKEHQREKSSKNFHTDSKSNRRTDSFQNPYPKPEIQCSPKDNGNTRPGLKGTSSTNNFKSSASKRCRRWDALFNKNWNAGGYDDDINCQCSHCHYCIHRQSADDTGAGRCCKEKHQCLSTDSVANESANTNGNNNDSQFPASKKYKAQSPLSKRKHATQIHISFDPYSQLNTPKQKLKMPQMLHHRKTSIRVAEPFIFKTQFSVGRKCNREGLAGNEPMVYIYPGLPAYRQNPYILRGTLPVRDQGQPPTNPKVKCRVSIGKAHTPPTTARSRPMNVLNPKAVPDTDSKQRYSAAPSEDAHHDRCPAERQGVSTKLSKEAVRSRSQDRVAPKSALDTPEFMELSRRGDRVAPQATLEARDFRQPGIRQDTVTPQATSETPEQRGPSQVRSEAKGSESSKQQEAESLDVRNYKVQFRSPLVESACPTGQDAKVDEVHNMCPDCQQAWIDKCADGNAEMEGLLAVPLVTSAHARAKRDSLNIMSSPKKVPDMCAACLKAWVEKCADDSAEMEGLMAVCLKTSASARMLRLSQVSPPKRSSLAQPCTPVTKSVTTGNSFCSGCQKGPDMCEACFKAWVEKCADDNAEMEGLMAVRLRTSASARMLRLSQGSPPKRSSPSAQPSAPITKSMTTVHSFCSGCKKDWIEKNADNFSEMEGLMVVPIRTSADTRTERLSSLVFIKGHSPFSPSQPSVIAQNLCPECQHDTTTKNAESYIAVPLRTVQASKR